MIDPEIQNYFDGEAFDPKRGYVDLAKLDRKVGHVQLHVAKAALKLALGDERKIVEDVIPDTAMYRTQLFNVLQRAGVDVSLSLFNDSYAPLVGSDDREFASLKTLTSASGNLAKYLERKEHGRPADPNDVVTAMVDLHDVALDLADQYGVDVDQAHLDRLESHLGRPLPRI